MIWRGTISDNARIKKSNPAANFTITSLNDVFGSGVLPATTESTADTALGPINVIALALDEMACTTASASAGRKRAQVPGIASLLHAGFTAGLALAMTRRRPLHFWRSLLNDFVF